MYPFFSLLFLLMMPLVTQQQTPVPPTSTDPAKPAPTPPAQTDPIRPATPPATPTLAPHSPEGVDVQPSPCLPGQLVDFQWPQGASKVLISGGGFGKRSNMTGLHEATDVAKRTTTYVFDLWYPNDKSADTPEGAGMSPGYHQVRVSVEVYPNSAHLTSYHYRRSWQVDYMAGWIYSDIPQSDPDFNSLIYFQPGEDSAERLAVAMLPIKNATSADLISMVMNDAPNTYDLLQNIRQKPTWQCGAPAIWLTFDGIDHALPGITTHSMVLAFVRNGIGYVISGRIKAGQYAQRERIMHCLVRSFEIEPNAPHPHVEGAKPVSNATGSPSHPAPAGAAGGR